MLRPKNIYSISPTTGSKSNTVTQASDLTGFRFSDKIIMIMSSVDNTAIRASTE